MWCTLFAAPCKVDWCTQGCCALLHVAQQMTWALSISCLHACLFPCFMPPHPGIPKYVGRVLYQEY